MSRFTASVQYNDLRGTAAADHKDHSSIQEYLREKELVSKDEFVVGLQLYVGENIGKIGYVGVAAFIYERNGNFDNVRLEVAAVDPVPVRRIDLELSIEEFIMLFKRFSVFLTVPSLQLDGREYKDQDE